MIKRICIFLSIRLCLYLSTYIIVYWSTLILIVDSSIYIYLCLYPSVYIQWVPPYNDPLANDSPPYNHPPDKHPCQAKIPITTPPFFFRIFRYSKFRQFYFEILFYFVSFINLIYFILFDFYFISIRPSVYVNISLIQLCIFLSVYRSIFLSTNRYRSNQIHHH